MKTGTTFDRDIARDSATGKLDAYIEEAVREDRLRMTDEFKGRIESSEREKAEGRRPRTRTGP